MKSWVEISEERLNANYRLLTSAASGVDVLAVVKADAYGHGARLCAPVLAAAGAPWLGVTDSAEGVAVREALQTSHPSSGRPLPGLLVMCGLLEEDADAIVRNNLTPVVWHRQQIDWLAASALRLGRERVSVHIEVDTGMARQGISPAELPSLLDSLQSQALQSQALQSQTLQSQGLIEVDGLLTHFASAEVAASPLTALQRERFQSAVHLAASAGLRPRWLHAGNSSAVDNLLADPAIHGGLLAWLQELATSTGARAMVRSGLALYGYCLPVEPHTSTSAIPKDPPVSRIRSSLRPVMQWKTRVIGVREVQAGDTVGYNATFVAGGPMRLALVPVGYADGLRRELSSKNTRPGGSMLVHSQPAPIVGRVSMNLTAIDVTGIDGVQPGDEVLVLGDGVSAEHHADLAHTIPYEILCGVRAERRLFSLPGRTVRSRLHPHGGGQ